MWQPAKIHQKSREDRQTLARIHEEPTLSGRAVPKRQPASSRAPARFPRAATPRRNEPPPHPTSEAWLGPDGIPLDDGGYQEPAEEGGWVEGAGHGNVGKRQVVEQYGPAARVGPHLRLQAKAGHRAGVIELRPGLYLVAEMPAQAMRTELGVAFLAPLALSLAAKALENPENTQRVMQAASSTVTTAVQALRESVSAEGWPDLAGAQSRCGYGMPSPAGWYGRSDMHGVPTLPVAEEDSHSLVPWASSSELSGWIGGAVPHGCGYGRGR